MKYEIEINKLNKINDAIEMLDEKKAYYWLEKLNDVNFYIMCINKIFDAEREKLKNKENNAENVIKDVGNSILELENMKKNKTNKIKTIINDTNKMPDVARITEIKNLKEIKIEIAYKKKELYTEMEKLQNEENKEKNIIKEIKRLELKFMKSYKIINTELAELFLLYKQMQ